MSNSSEHQLIFRIYEIVKSWLEYAEKKNAILFTIVGFELAILQFVDQRTNFRFIEITIAFLIFAFIFALISFYPKTDRLFFSKKPSSVEDIDKLNLLFYGDIQKFSRESYINAIEKSYDVKVESDKVAQDLCDQIVVLSKIASAKFLLFKVAIYATIGGQFALFLTVAFNRLINR